MEEKEVRLNAVACKKRGASFVQTSEEDADFIVIPREDFLRILFELGANATVLNTQLGGKYNTQCPECGFVAEGFDTEEEAVAWDCSECQPTLPGMDLPIG